MRPDFLTIFVIAIVSWGNTGTRLFSGREDDGNNSTEAEEDDEDEVDEADNTEAEAGGTAMSSAVSFVLFPTSVAMVAVSLVVLDEAPAGGDGRTTSSSLSTGLVRRRRDPILPMPRITRRAAARHGFFFFR